MKHKTFQPSIILLLVAIAFFIKAAKDNEPILYAVGAFVFVVTALRTRLITKFQNQDVDTGEDEDMILKYLKKDPILYVEMIEVYKRDNFKLMYQEFDGLLFYDYETKYYFASATNLEAARDIVRMLPDDFYTFVAHDLIFEQAIKKDLKVAAHLYSYNYVYESKERFEVDNKEIDFRLLGEADIEVVKEHYTVKSLCTDEYIGGCIKRGMLGAYVDGELAGFIGQHDSGCLGMLEVFEAYRKRNIATLLQCNMINILLDNGHEGAIYAQVNVENEISMHLQEKLGFKRSKTPTIWNFSY